MTQLCIFVPILTLDERRIAASRNFLIWCFKHKNHKKHNGAKKTSMHRQSNLQQQIQAVGAVSPGLATPNEPGTPRDHTPRDITLPDPEDAPNMAVTPVKQIDIDEEPTSIVSIQIIDPNEDPFQPANKKETGKNKMQHGRCNSCLSKFSMDYILVDVLVPILTNRTYRIIIYLLFTCAFIASILSFESINTETDETLLLPDNSFITKFLNVLADGFGQSTAGVEMVVKNRDFSEFDTRQDVLAMINAFTNDFHSQSGAYSPQMTEWVTPFDYWLNSTYNISVNSLTQQEYYGLLKQFSNTTGYQQWQDSIIYDNYQSPTEIVATKFDILAEFPLSVLDRWQFYVDSRNTFNNAIDDSSSGFVFSPSFLYAYLAYAIVGFTIENLGYALLGVFVVMLLLMDIRIAVLIAFIIATIDVEIIGWMALNKIALDTLAYGELVLSVGLTVDYIIHVTLAITVAKPDNPNDYKQRLTMAFHDMGVGVAKGALTTLLGLGILVLSNAAAFRIFFVMFCGIIVISVLHGFILIPAILAECSFLYT